MAKDSFYLHASDGLFSPLTALSQPRGNELANKEETRGDSGFGLLSLGPRLRGMPAAPAPGQVAATSWPEWQRPPGPGRPQARPSSWECCLRPGLHQRVAKNHRRPLGPASLPRSLRATQAGPEQPSPTALFTYCFHFLILLLVFHFKGIHDHILLIKVETLIAVNTTIL